jgi:hypothetical protein
MRHNSLLLFIGISGPDCAFDIWIKKLVLFLLPQARRENPGFPPLSQSELEKKFKIPFDQNSCPLPAISCEMHSTHQHTLGHDYVYWTFFRLRGSEINFALLNATCVHNCYRK